MQKGGKLGLNFIIFLKALIQNFFKWTFTHYIVFYY